VCLPAQKLTRSSSGDEIANVNFLYDDDDVHALQNTIDSCIVNKADIFSSTNNTTSASVLIT